MEPSSQILTSAGQSGTRLPSTKHALKDEWELQNIAVIPVIVGARGIMKDNLQGYLDSIPDKPSK